MGSKGNLAKDYRKAHLHLQPKIRLHLHHLGVRLHSGVNFHLKVHHSETKVYFPFLVVFHSHEENYHRLL
jgi:hypothetical protein